MTNLDDVSQLLATARAVAPPAGSVEMGLSRLLTSLATNAAPLPIASGSLMLGSVAVANWVAVGFLVGLTGAGVVAYGTSAQAPEPVVPPAVAQVPASAPVEPGSQPALPAVVSSSQAAPVVEPKQPRAPSAPAIAPEVGAAPRFDEELRLITAAKRELDAGHPPLARAWLDEHQQRHPGGVFALEREGLRVLASCGEAARPELARDFARRYPTSPMLPQLRRRCGAENPTPAASNRDFPEAGK